MSDYSNENIYITVVTDMSSSFYSSVFF
jgi:hypothetical protein